MNFGGPSATPQLPPSFGGPPEAEIPQVVKTAVAIIKPINDAIVKPIEQAIQTVTGKEPDFKKMNEDDVSNIQKKTDIGTTEEYSFLKKSNDLKNTQQAKREEIQAEIKKKREISEKELTQKLKDLENEKKQDIPVQQPEDSIISQLKQFKPNQFTLQDLADVYSSSETIVQKDQQTFHIIANIIKWGGGITIFLALCKIIYDIIYPTPPQKLPAAIEEIKKDNIIIDKKSEIAKIENEKKIDTIIEKTGIIIPPP